MIDFNAAADRSRPWPLRLALQGDAVRLPAPRRRQLPR
jgi:hypothetical protein